MTSDDTTTAKELEWDPIFGALTRGAATLNHHMDANDYTQHLYRGTTATTLKRELGDIKRTLATIAKKAEQVTLNTVDRQRIGVELTAIGQLLEDMHNLTST